jgi:MoaA/NifB/PqqE/SkfB family radical SAM enzyme
MLVPPFLILSVTPNCNLCCPGGFAVYTGNLIDGSHNPGVLAKSYFDWEEWRSIIKEASKRGVFGFVLAGGEPFMVPNLLDLCNEFRDRFFIIITNGTTLRERDYEILKKSNNIELFVSIEGGEELTYIRRGDRVYEQTMTTLGRFSRIGVPNGISVTLSKLNFGYWMDHSNLDHLVEQGVRLGLFIEYVPFPSGSCDGLSTIRGSEEWATTSEDSLILDEEERSRFRDMVRDYRARRAV